MISPSATEGRLGPEGVHTKYFGLCETNHQADQIFNWSVPKLYSYVLYKLINVHKVLLKGPIPSISLFLFTS